MQEKLCSGNAFAWCIICLHAQYLVKNHGFYFGNPSEILHIRIQFVGSREVRYLEIKKIMNSDVRLKVFRLILFMHSIFMTPYSSFLKSHLS